MNTINNSKMTDNFVLSKQKIKINKMYVAIYALHTDVNQIKRQERKTVKYIVLVVIYQTLFHAV